MDPNQNSDQASQIPGMPQDDSSAVPQSTPVPEPTMVPEPLSVPEPAPAPEPGIVPEVPSETVEEISPPPPAVEEQKEAGQAVGSQALGSDTNQAV